jgi:2',3'-cyclic-nucleotide 2'-phosphodiesterase (5'-nucleotidase family)
MAINLGKTLACISLSVGLISCSVTQYEISSINAQRYTVTNSESTESNKEVRALVSKYKHLLEQEMNLAIGESEETMTYNRPESLLTNLTSDVMLKYANNQLNMSCDLSLMNVYGHRSNLAKGPITIGNMYEIYSFENALTILELKGSDLLEVFDSYARMGGAGISSTVHLVIKDKKLLHATVHGQPIHKDKVYSIVTIDYLAEGNDGLEALKEGSNLLETELTLRSIMIDYVKTETAKGHKITSKLDNRIVVEQK